MKFFNKLAVIGRFKVLPQFSSPNGLKILKGSDYSPNETAHFLADCGLDFLPKVGFVLQKHLTFFVKRYKL